MSTSHEIAAYCQGKLGPDQIRGYKQYIQQSGLTIPILSLLHIGRIEVPGQIDGDLIYNDYPKNLLVRKCGFNPFRTPDIEDWPNRVAQLKQNSSVKKIFISIGGSGATDDLIFDFRTIQRIIEYKQEQILWDNFTALRNAFTIAGHCVIDGIDLNCEEEPYVTHDTIVCFSKMLFDLGFEVTFGPYRKPEWWQCCMQRLWPKYKVSWWNLQCYDGGRSNSDPEEFQKWIEILGKVVGSTNAAYFLMPGLLVRYMEQNGGIRGQCPSTIGGSQEPGIQQTFARLSGNTPGLRGGFVWSYDLINDSYQNPNVTCPNKALVNYVTAVRNGLDGNG
jgi:hypothetical protein